MGVKAPWAKLPKWRNRGFGDVRFWRIPEMPPAAIDGRLRFQIGRCKALNDVLKCATVPH